MHYLQGQRSRIFFRRAGLSLRAGGQGFSPATRSLSPGYFDTKRKYSKEKNASNYKVMNLKKQTNSLLIHTRIHLKRGDFTIPVRLTENT